STAVLPDPAGASSTIEAPGSVAALRAASSCRSRGSLIGFLREGAELGGEVRADAAQIREVAVVAGSGRRIDARLAGEEGTDEPPDERHPRLLLRAPVGDGCPGDCRNGFDPRQ